jgi:glutathione S-transferase
MLMRLFAMPGTCALAPNIVAMWGGVALDIVNLKRGEQREPAYLAINPKGQVPALELDDGSILTEASAIMRYLAAIAPNALVRPDNPAGWGKVDEALSYFTSEVHADFGGHFAPQRFAESDAGQAEVREATYAKLRHHAVRIAASIEGQGNSYYLGTRSIADAYLFTVLRWFDGTPIALTDYPLLLAYRDRMAQDPDVQAALARQNMA